MNDRLCEAVEACGNARRTRAEAEPDRFRQPNLWAPREPEPDWRAPASMTDQWADHALDVVREVASERNELTVAEIVPRLREPTYDTRSIGPILLRAARRGWIEPIGWTSGGAVRHGRPVRVWRSNLVRERTPTEAGVQIGAAY